MRAQVRQGIRVAIVVALVVAGLFAGAAYARSTRGVPPCPPALTGPAGTPSTCEPVADSGRERLLMGVGGFLAAAVAIPATWPLTRRRGERFWLD